METWITIALILSFIIVLIVGIFGFIKVQEIIAEEENAKKERFCHHCHYAYIHRTHENYVYCPQCGKPLRKIDDNPLSEEVDFDTWLENQPEGTFVQGGGIDTEENSQNNDKKD